jgi:hypothetical protein
MPEPTISDLALAAAIAYDIYRNTEYRVSVFHERYKVTVEHESIFGGQKITSYRSLTGGTSYVSPTGTDSIVDIMDWPDLLAPDYNSLAHNTSRVIKDFTTRHGIKSVVATGHSLGGGSVAAAAAMVPDSIDYAVNIQGPSRHPTHPMRSLLETIGILDKVKPAPTYSIVSGLFAGPIQSLIELPFTYGPDEFPVTIDVSQHSIRKAAENLALKERLHDTAFPNAFPQEPMKTARGSESSRPDGHAPNALGGRTNAADSHQSGSTRSDSIGSFGGGNASRGVGSLSAAEAYGRNAASRSNARGSRGSLANSPEASPSQRPGARSNSRGSSGSLANSPEASPSQRAGARSPASPAIEQRSYGYSGSSRSTNSTPGNRATSQRSYSDPMASDRSPGYGGGGGGSSGKDPVLFDLGGDGFARSTPKRPSRRIIRAIRCPQGGGAEPGHRSARFGLAGKSSQTGLPASNTSSTGTCSAVASWLVLPARPMIASNSPYCSSVMPLARAAAVWEWMQ